MKKQPFETRFHNLSGNAAIDLFGKDDINSLSQKLIANYNPDRFEATALRFFIQKGKPIITIYAVDKFKQEKNNYPKDKLPVKKFKLSIPFEAFLQHLKRFDFTVSNDAYDIKDIL